MVNGLSYAPSLRPAAAPASRDAVRDTGAAGMPGAPAGAAAQAQRATTPVPSAQPRPLTAPGATDATPVEPPPGTDPQLWMVLSADERAHFARLGAMGPLTYGRTLDAQSPTSSLRGMRLDIKG